MLIGFLALSLYDFLVSALAIFFIFLCVCAYSGSRARNPELASLRARWPKLLKGLRASAYVRVFFREGTCVRVCVCVCACVCVALV